MNNPNKLKPSLHVIVDGAYGVYIKEEAYSEKIDNVALITPKPLKVIKRLFNDSHQLVYISVDDAMRKGSLIQRYTLKLAVYSKNEYQIYDFLKKHQDRFYDSNARLFPLSNAG